MVGEGKEANRIWREELQRKSEEAGGEGNLQGCLSEGTGRGAVEKIKRGGKSKGARRRGRMRKRQGAYLRIYSGDREREKKNVVDEI